MSGEAFLDILSKVGWRPHQERRKPCQERGGLGGRSPPSKSGRKHAQSKPGSSEKSSKNHRKSSPDPPKNRGQEALERSSKAGSYPEPLSGSCMPKFWSHFFGFWGVLAPKMAPCWRPRRSQDAQKIDAKKDEILKASWKLKIKRILDLGGQHGGKLAPKSMPKSMWSSNSAFLKKPCFSLGKL